MTIEEGDKPEDGPIFKVQVNSSKTIFTGATPTAPWTDACKKSKSQGTRVSGPLVSNIFINCIQLGRLMKEGWKEIDVHNH